VLIELAREHRRVVSWDEMPLILRQAILAAEDKNFFSHSGVDYSVLPRVVLKMAVRPTPALDGGPAVLWRATSSR
jgi:membrane carboxypeptidase/penicillin-binding protein